jgi:hypothetical protein
MVRKNIASDQAEPQVLKWPVLLRVSPQVPQAAIRIGRGVTTRCERPHRVVVIREEVAERAW